MTQCRRVRSHTWPACPLPLRQFRALIRRLWAPHVAGRDRAVVALDCEILGIESAAGDHPPPRAVGDRRLWGSSSLLTTRSTDAGWDVTAGVCVNHGSDGHGW